METKIDALVSKMERSRQRLNAALDQIAPQAEIYPSWKLKQMLDHITGWDELVAKSLLTYKKGDEPGPAVKGGINQFNAESVAAREGMPVERSRFAYDAARQRVIKILCELPPEMLAQRFKAPWGGYCTVASIVKIFVSHEQEHAQQIENIISHPISEP